MAGRKQLPIEEKKIRIEPFVKKKIVDLIGKKECEKLSVEAIGRSYRKRI